MAALGKLNVRPKPHLRQGWQIWEEWMGTRAQ